MPGNFHGPAPCIGEHSQEILTELLGLSAAEVDALAQQQVVF